MLAFLIWGIIGAAFTGYGLYALCTKRTLPFGFWANAEMFEVSDVKAYNRAMGKLWCIFGIVFILLGIPLLLGGNSPYIIISILGCPAEAIAAMAVYVTVIEKKYRS